MEAPEGYAPIGLRIHLDVVADRIRGPYPGHAMRLQPAPFHDPIEHALSIIEKLRRLGTHERILQDLRVAAVQFPRLEKGCPIDVGDEFLDRQVAERKDPC